MADPITVRPSVAPNAIAPDGTEVRLLAALAGGSFAHFQLPAGEVSGAVRHRTVEEIWHFVAGRGSLWRRKDGYESIEEVKAGTCVTIPLGTEFQFRASAEAALAFVAVTMPPWPGADEAIAVKGPWTPTARRP